MHEQASSTEVLRSDAAYGEEEYFMIAVSSNCTNVNLTNSNIQRQQ